MDSTTASTYNKVGWHRSNVHFNALCCDNAFKTFNRRQTAGKRREKPFRYKWNYTSNPRFLMTWTWEAPEIKFECTCSHYIAIFSPVMPLMTKDNWMTLLKIGLNWNYIWTSFIMKHRSVGIAQCHKVSAKTEIYSKTLRIHRMIDYQCEFTNANHNRSAIRSITEKLKPMHE